MEYKIIRVPRRKRIAFRINRAGGVDVLAPPDVSVEELDEVVDYNKELIEQMKADTASSPKYACFSFTEGEMFPFFDRSYPLHLSRRISSFDEENGFAVPGGEVEEIRKSMVKLYCKLALPVFQEKCAAAAAKAGLEFARVSIINCKECWGRCSRKKELRFCWRLLLGPEKLADYIVWHELAHLKHMDHSPDFWSYVEKFCPDYRECRDALDAMPDQWG